MFLPRQKLRNVNIGQIRPHAKRSPHVAYHSEGSQVLHLHCNSHGLVSGSIPEREALVEHFPFSELPSTAKRRCPYPPLETGQIHRIPLHPIP